MTAKTNVTSQAIDNESSIKTAEVKLIAALIELKKYAGETAGIKIAKFKAQPQVQAYLKDGFEDDVNKESAAAQGKFTSGVLADVSTYEGTIETARSDRDSWADRANWSRHAEEGLLQPKPGGRR